MEIRIDPQADALLKRLNGAGFAAYVVGGCVRDSILKRPAHDWDITTDALPQQLLALFSQEHCVTDGLKHGTVTVIRGGVPYEITSFRADGQYADHRRPESVRLNVSLQEDLARRDFTVNAMAYSPEKGLCDPYGGRFDLEHGILRAVGDAPRRFEEDALRILRVLRFSAELDFVIERETAEAMRATSDAEAIMSPRSARTRCIRPMPTKDRQMSIRQKQTSTAMAVKFRKYMLFTPRLPSASFLKAYYNPLCNFFNTLFVNK